MKPKVSLLLPAKNKIHERKFIKPEEFLNYCRWGNAGRLMIKTAIKAWRKV